MAKENPNDQQNPTPGPVEVLANGCVRQKSTGRGAYELMSPFVAEADAKLFEWGSKNRGERNWEKGCPFSRCVQSMYRHLIKFTMRESDEDHDDNLAAIRFWAGAMIHYQEMIRRGILPASLDDMPHYGKVDLTDKATSDLLAAINNDAGAYLTKMHLRDKPEISATKKVNIGPPDGPVDSVTCGCVSNKFAERRAIMNCGWADGGCFPDSDYDDDDFEVCEENPACKNCGFLECDCDECNCDRCVCNDTCEECGCIFECEKCVVSIQDHQRMFQVGLRIYVAGPITADSTKQSTIHNNLGKSIGEFLRSKGHTVFIPHNYEAVLGDEEYEEILKLDFSIIKEWAQALFVIHPSPGANREAALAEELGLPIFRSLDEVWTAKTNS